MVVCFKDKEITKYLKDYLDDYCTFEEGESVEFYINDFKEFLKNMITDVDEVEIILSDSQRDILQCKLENKLNDIDYESDCYLALCELIEEFDIDTIRKLIAENW